MSVNPSHSANPVNPGRAVNPRKAINLGSQDFSQHKMCSLPVASDGLEATIISPERNVESDKVLAGLDVI